MHRNTCMHLCTCHASCPARVHATHGSIANLGCIHTCVSMCARAMSPAQLECMLHMVPLMNKHAQIHEYACVHCCYVSRLSKTHAAQCTRCHCKLRLHTYMCKHVCACHVSCPARMHGTHGSIANLSCIHTCVSMCARAGGGFAADAA